MEINVNEEADEALREWARYAVSSVRKEVGYKGYTIEHVMMYYGGSVPRGTGGHPGIVWPASVDRTESAVCKLPEQYRAAIIVRYMTPGNRKEKAVRYSKRMKMPICSESWYRQIVDAARAMYWGVLLSQEN